MVKVYYESKRHAEIVAIFNTKETYMKCLPALKKAAKEAGMTVTESVVDEENVEDLYL